MKFLCRTNISHDVWQFGIVIFVCLTGCLPWQKAAMDDPRYVRYLSWQNTNIPLKRQPKLFKLVSSKAQRLFKRYLEPKPDKRPNGLVDVHRYLEDRWMSKGMEKTNETLQEDEGLCPSMYSFHSSPEEKNKLLFTLTQYGLETTVDRIAKKDRIRDWIQNSVIEEEDDQGLNEERTEEDLKIRDNQNGPNGEQDETRGPISESKVKKWDHSAASKREKRMATLKKPLGNYKPPIDPRIPFEHQRNQQNKEIFRRSSQNEERQYSTSHLQNESNGIKEKSGTEVVQNQTDRFGIAAALPFQNMKISNSLNSSESTFSSDSSGTIKHNINIQVSQSKTISRNGFIR